MIPEEIRNRKGARNAASVPPAVLDLPDKGFIETFNLRERLVTDRMALAERLSPARVGKNSRSRRAPVSQKTTRDRA